MSNVLAGNIDPEDVPYEPGEWQLRMMGWTGEVRGPMFLFGCPHGRGTCGVPVQPSPPNIGGCSWSWDGNTEAPTLTPSINCVTHRKDGTPTAGCGFHKTFVKGGWV